MTRNKTEAYTALIAAGWTVEEIEQVFPPQKESTIGGKGKARLLPISIKSWGWTIEEIEQAIQRRSSGTVPPKPPAPPPQPKRSSFNASLES